MPSELSDYCRLHAGHLESSKAGLMATPNSPRPSSLPVSPQLELPLVAQEVVGHTPKGHSNTVDLFDACLAFSTRRVRPAGEMDERLVRYGHNEYVVRITTALLPGPDGTMTYVMPGEREDLVEKALRKLAAESVEAWHLTTAKGQVEISLNFTLSQIRSILAETGHDFKLKEIDEALRVLQAARIEIKARHDGADVGVISGIIQTYVYARKKQPGTKDQDARGCVKLHPLITKSFLEATYRRFDFRLLMTMRSRMARWLYQRMTQAFKQAGTEDTYMRERGYNLSLQTILRESGLLTAMRLRQNLQVIRTALKELQETGVLNQFHEDVRHEKLERGRPKIVDVVWNLNPSFAFVDDAVASNQARQKVLAERATARLRSGTSKISDGAE